VRRAPPGSSMALFSLLCSPCCPPHLSSLREFMGLSPDKIGGVEEAADGATAVWISRWILNPSHPISYNGLISP
jgi:hypothetical protein